jgi:2-hydroxychromene-2-carboxylate isomerase
MHDGLFADPARLEDPHLWERARRIGLDLERFDADRRAQATTERVKADFRSGIRAGVVTTPTVFLWERELALALSGEELLARLRR